MVSEDVSLREYIETRLNALEVSLAAQINASQSYAEFAIDALSTTVKAHDFRLERVESRISGFPSGVEERLRSIEDVLTGFRAQRNLIAGAVGLAVGGSGAFLIQQLAG